MTAILDRKFQILLHKVGYLRLEVEDSKDIMTEHEKEFNARCYSDILEENDEEESSEEEKQEKDQNESTHERDEENLSDIDDQKKENDNKNEPEDEKKEEVESSSQKDKAPPEIKKIWKLIAVKTHPDKTNNDVEMAKLYKKSLSALEEGRYEEILEIASMLSIKIENPSEELISALEKRVEQLELDLKKIKENVIWTWASADDQKKEAIQNALKDYRRKNKKKRKKKK